MTRAAIPPATRERLDALLEHQPHCELHLARLAAPGGRSVLVVGPRAAAEALWCLKRGARNVLALQTGESSAAPDAEALRLAAELFGLALDESACELRAGTLESIATAVTSARPFELAIVGGVGGPGGDGRTPDALLAACMTAIGPGGRIALVTTPISVPSAWAPAPLLAAAEAAGLATLELLRLEPSASGGEPPRNFAEGSAGTETAAYGVELARRPRALDDSGRPWESIRAAEERRDRLRNGRVSRLVLAGDEGSALAPPIGLPVDPDGEALALRFTLPPTFGLRSLRWEPLAHRFARIWLTEATWEDDEGRPHPLEPAALRTNGTIGTDGSIRFSTLEPWIAFDLAPGARPARLALTGAWKVTAPEVALAELEARLETRLGRIARLYLDTGRGFSEAEVLLARVDPTASRLALRFELPAPATVRRVRFVPTEGHFCRLRIETLFAERPSGARVPQSVAQVETNAWREADGGLLFDTLEPWLAFTPAGEIAAVEVRGTWQVLDAAGRVAELRTELDVQRAAGGVWRRLFGKFRR